MLTKEEIDHFIQNGYIRIDNAFSDQIAIDVMDILWNDLPCERENPLTWTEPVIRLQYYSQEAFIQSVNNKRLHSIYDQLVGLKKWNPCMNIGTFPIRFPSNVEPDDVGPHVDASFPGDDINDFLKWRVNVFSKGRALLMLVIFSDISEDDAPTIVYRKSHFDVAKLLLPKGKFGLSFIELANELKQLPEREKVLAIGKPGTIYLCHPFIVHSAQTHNGKSPRFMAQPSLNLKNELDIMRADIIHSPIARAIRKAVI